MQVEDSFKNCTIFFQCGMEDPVCGNPYSDSINSTYASELADSPPIQLSYRNSFASFANILSSPKKPSM